MRRSPRARLAIAIAAALLGITACASAPQQHRAPGQAPTTSITPSGNIHVVRYEKDGGAATCTSGGCQSSGFVPLTFTLPANTTGYRSTLTVSFRYSVDGARGNAGVGGYIEHASSGRSVQLTPAFRPLLSTDGRAQSMTVVFRPALMTPGSYRMHVGPTFAHHLDSSGNVVEGTVSMSKVVYTLGAWTA